MLVTYVLTLADHLAWFDYHFVRVARPWWSRVPIFGPILVRRRRQKFADAMSAPANATALGERSLEFSNDVIREHGPTFDFSTRWQDLAFAALTPEHLFLVHPSMNAHIVPLRDVAGDALIPFVTVHAPLVRDHRHA